MSEKQEFELEGEWVNGGDPTKCLIKSHLEYRDKMREIVKDFPSMRNEAGISKNLGDQLLGLMRECQESLDETEMQNTAIKSMSSNRNNISDKRNQP